MLLTAKRLGLGDAQTILNALIAQTPTVIAAVQALLPAAFPQTIAEPVFTGLQTSASQLQCELIGYQPPHPPPAASTKASTQLSRVSAWCS